MSSLSFQLGPKETLRTAVENGRAYREQIADQLPANQAAPGAFPLSDLGHHSDYQKAEKPSKEAGRNSWCFRNLVRLDQQFLCHEK